VVVILHRDMVVTPASVLIVTRLSVVQQQLIITYPRRRRIGEREDALGESEVDLAARHARLAQAAGSARRELLALRADRAKVRFAACQSFMSHPVRLSICAQTASGRLCFRNVRVYT